MEVCLLFSNVINVFWVGKFNYKPKLNIEKHTHPFYHVIYIMNGYGMAKIDNKEYS